MTRVNPSNGNKTKSAIFLWDVFKFDIVYFFLIKKYVKYFSDFQNKISQFYD